MKNSSNCEQKDYKFERFGIICETVSWLGGATWGRFTGICWGRISTCTCVLWWLRCGVWRSGRRSGIWRPRCSCWIWRSWCRGWRSIRTRRCWNDWSQCWTRPPPRSLIIFDFNRVINPAISAVVANFIWSVDNEVRVSVWVVGWK